MARMAEVAPRSPDLYERISTGYAAVRRADPRIAAAIEDALGEARTVVNVGAGTGNYEPPDRSVVAVEPALAMIRQRPAGSAPVVRGVAEHLPFPDGAFDAAMGTLTVHHWSDREAGLAELRRVARRQVLFFYDSSVSHAFWAVEYFPEALAVPSEQTPPDGDWLARHLDVQEVRVVPVPFDCTDAFGTAFWGRPERYLDPEVHQAMSWLAQLPDDVRQAGSARLRADLESGEWDRRHGHLRSLTELDCGYRVVIAGP